MRIFASRPPCGETSGNGDLRRKGVGMGLLDDERISNTAQRELSWLSAQKRKN